jgi:LuxR family maltose regulon positive regulatory protein
MHILASKVTRPVPPPRIVDRPRIYARLDQWQSIPVIFVHAPAGYGKSILASRWLEIRGLDAQAAWLSLDPGDDDPLQFLRYLAAALEVVVPGMAAAVEPLLDEPEVQPVRVLEVLLSIIQREPQPPDNDPLLLVLDDLHHVDSPALAPLMTLFLERRPSQLHFMLLGRWATYGPLARPYAAGQVLDLSEVELRFQPDEMETYLMQRSFLPLTAEALARLEAQTEGWIVALQLTAAAVAKTGDIDELLAASQSRSGWLAEYLTTQILDGLPPARRTFLLEISILDQFNGSLAAAVSGTTAADIRLSALIGAGLPLVQLDSRQEWFRYHHLFQELLQKQLRQEQSSAAVATLHRRAATWLARHDQVTAAVQHALAVDDLSLAAAILEAAVRPEILRGGTKQAQSWLALFPNNALDQHPRLLLNLCLLAMMRNQAYLMSLVARTDAALASALIAEAARQRVQAELSVFKMAAFYFQRDLESARALGRDIQQYVALLDPISRGIFAFLQMHLALFNGEGRYALAKGNQAIEAFQDAAFDHGTISVRREQARISAYFGRPREALAMFQEIMDRAQPDDSFTIRELISTLLTASSLRYLMDDLEGAQREQQSALALAQRLAEPALISEIASLSALFAMARATGRSGEVEDAWPIGRKSSIPLLNRLHLHQLVRQGQVERAWQFANALGVQVDGEITNNHLPDFVSLLEVTVARGIDREAVTPQIAAAILQAERTGGRLFAAELYALSAWDHLQINQREEAEYALIRALDLAVDTGYVRFILDIPALGPLLASLDHPAAAEMWVATVPEALRRRAAQLTNQERLVLAHLSEPARYQDIADNLGISINTVRTHIRHIYRKLGVSKREDAVARACALGLIAHNDLIPNVAIS